MSTAKKKTARKPSAKKATRAVIEAGKVCPSYFTYCAIHNDNEPRARKPNACHSPIYALEDVRAAEQRILKGEYPKQTTERRGR